MTSLSPRFYEPIEKDLYAYMYSVMWHDIVNLLDDSNLKLNASDPDSELIKAIKSGKITYVNGTFSGSFNVRIVKELKTFATYNKRTKTWHGIPHHSVVSVASLEQSKSKVLTEKILSSLEDLPNRVEGTIDDISINIEPVAEKIIKQTNSDLRMAGITLDDSDVVSKDVYETYRNNQKINIKNFTDEQSKSLIDLIRSQATTGYNRDALIQMVKDQFSVTQSKARFLARQETSLFVSSLRNERFSSAGVNVAIWSSSQDSRVVGKPGGKFPIPSVDHGNHFNMNGKYVSVSDPTIYAETLDDVKAGLWKSKSTIGGDNKHAGESFNCRCVYRPVIL